MDYARPVTLDESRRISLAAGVLFLITFIASIPALWLFQPVLDDPIAYIAGNGDSDRIFLGVTLELVGPHAEDLPTLPVRPEVDRTLCVAVGLEPVRGDGEADPAGPARLAARS